MRLPIRLPPVSIFARIAIGNSVIIVFGAIAGTLLTHILTDVAAHWLLIFFFSTAGILLSVTLNFFLVRAALDPLHRLQGVVHQLEHGKASVDQLLLEDSDPDTRRLSNALISLVNQLEATNQELRTLSERAIMAQEEERKRIARSLHDDTGQALSMLIIHLERLQDSLPSELTQQVARLETAHQLAKGLLDELRQVIAGLRPAILDDLGLIPAMRWYARAKLEAAGIQLHFSAPEPFIDLPSHLSTNLFRIGQEAVNNIVRHANARQAAISLGFTEKDVYLQVEDDGQGFDVPGSPGEAMRLQHWGLVGIQERVELVRGTFSVTSEPGKGTLIKVSVPCASTSQAQSAPSLSDSRE